MNDHDTSRGARERELFLRALEFPTTTQRVAFLDQECGRDAVLRASIDALLGQDLKDGFLESPATPTLRDAAGSIRGLEGVVPTPLGPRPGDRIGPYTLLQGIGEGGCGTVFLAEQQEPVRRQVALKVINPGMDTRSVIARFETERQALAMMDHPNIARVLDAGATEAGRPYFVMELVRGIRITEYCDQSRLSTVERLKLFVRVCQAIQHAHQKGVIHRDIKPSNILVTLHDGLPIPKVIDFGIAKAIDQRLTDKTLLTDLRAFIGTPAYMSPEQAEMGGLDIDTRADVYSLGVLLYELLTGHTPFEARELIASGLDTMRRTIREQEPVPPSTRLRDLEDPERTRTATRHRSEPARLESLFRGDLDWIVLKALEKDRARRYPTALDVAGDIQRFLDSEPVLARPPSTIYRLQKLVRRNRLSFIAAGAFVTALCVGIALALWQSFEKGAALRRAVAAEQQERLLREQAQEAQATESHLRLRAESQELAARQSAYAADMNLAQHALSMNNLGRAGELLDRHRPQPGVLDLRGWEWRYLWQQCRSDALYTLCRRSNEVHLLTASHDGNFVAIGDTSGTLALWDLRTRQELSRFSTEAGRMVATFSPASPTLAYSTADERNAPPRSQRVRLWDILHSRPTGDLPIRGACRGLFFSQDGSLLLVADSEGRLTRWRLPELQSAGHIELAGFGGFGATLQVSADHSVAAYAMDRGRIRVVDLTTGIERWTAQAADENVMSIAFSPDHRLLATGAGFVESTVRLWDVETGNPRGALEGHRTYVSALLFWPDGRTLASASGDQTIRLWDLKGLGHDAPSLDANPGPGRGEEIPAPQLINALRGHRLEVWSIALLPDLRTLISGCKDGSVNVWDTGSPRRDHAHLTLPGNFRHWGFAPDSQSILTVDSQGRIERWQGTEFQDSEVQLETEGRLFVARFSADQRRVALLLDGDRLQVWDVRQRRLVRTWNASQGGGLPLGFVAGSGHLLTRGRGDEGLQEWNVDTGEKVRAFDLGFEGGFWSSLAFAPDASWWLGSGNGASALLHETATGQTIPLDLGSSVRPNRWQGGFSPDARWFAVVSGQGTGSLWQTSPLVRRSTLSGFLQGLHSVAFSPDGRRLAIGSNGREAIKLWDTEHPQELLTLDGEGSSFEETAFSPDARLIGSRNRLGIVHLWRAPSMEEIAGVEAKDP